ncbi:hypothetical protein TMP139_770004 [Tenacibaculum maritimum]|nr:hypothetical protein TMP139_770004 [Tenacibaculum maritimum]
MNFVKDHIKNKIILEKLMKSLTGKFFFLFLSCNHNCSDENMYINSLNLANKVKDIILKEHQQDYIELKEDKLKKNVTLDEYNKLISLGFEKMVKIENNIILSFKKKYQKNWLDKKLETNNKFCAIHLIFSNSKEDKQNILHLEQYSDCRLKVKEINNNWMYVLQIWDCN